MRSISWPSKERKLKVPPPSFQQKAYSSHSIRLTPIPYLNQPEQACDHPTPYTALLSQVSERVSRRWSYARLTCMSNIYRYPISTYIECSRSSHVLALADGHVSVSLPLACKFKVDFSITFNILEIAEDPSKSGAFYQPSKSESVPSFFTYIYLYLSDLDRSSSSYASQFRKGFR